MKMFRFYKPLLLTIALLGIQLSYANELLTLLTRRATVASALAVSFAGHKAYQLWRHFDLQTQKKRVCLEVKPVSDNDFTTIFAHGLEGTRNTGLFYKRQGFVQGNLATFDFPNSRLGQRKPACLAQEDDINCLAEYVEKTKGRKCLYGLSRGAATIATFMGTYITEHVDAIILESPFDDIQTVVNNILSKIYLHLIPGLTTLGTLLCSCIYSRYSAYGIRPIDVVHKIQKDVAIFIICSEEDELIPTSSSIALYTKLIESGHTKTHLLVLKKGKHAQLELLDSKDSEQYRQDVHAFLRHYGLPHDAALAKESVHPDFKDSDSKQILAASAQHRTVGVVAAD